jgi:hypothetical protein
VNALAETSCHGYAIDSEIALRFTRRGASPDALSVVAARGEEPVHDEEPLLEWHTPDGVAGKLFGGGQIFDFWASGTGWFRIAPAERTIEVPDAEPLDAFRELHLWGVPTMVTFTRHGQLSLHAAGFESGGGAVLVAAPGRHGKTTLALALHAAGTRLLTEDIARVSFQPEPVVLPGPAVIRMRSDAMRDVPPGTTVVKTTSERIVLAIDEERRGGSAPVPLRAVVLLRIAEDGRIQLDRLDSATAIRDMWALSFRIPDSPDRTRAFEQLADLARTTPVYNLQRPLTFETLPRVVEIVRELCDS